ncbi:MAG: phosphoglycerate mutase, partial [Candidatus ainarchaeum sp.]|nr:phosphoglycerate mutase [Candidatus ainarchaeum sp.]
EKEANMRLGNVQIMFRASAEHRGALVLRGAGLSPNVSATDSHSEGAFKSARPLDSSREAKRTAEIVNAFTKAVRARLEASKVNRTRIRGGMKPANAILLRGAGILRKAPKFSEMHGIKGACIAGGALYKGVARYLGMDVPEVRGATGDAKTNLKAKGMAALKALQENDFVFVHVKATDSFAHDGDAGGKTKFIERVDRELIPLLAEGKAALLITGDHSTACARKAHTGYDVPVLVWEKGGRSDGLRHFDERSAMGGGLGHIKGKDVMPIILNMIGKGRMYGS